MGRTNQFYKGSLIASGIVGRLEYCNKQIFPVYHLSRSKEDHQDGVFAVLHLLDLPTHSLIGVGRTLKKVYSPRLT